MSATAPQPVVNAMTVDVEDYFQVTAFDGVVSRRQWERHESRVCANTDRLLDLFAETGLRATFFVLGWVASRHPALVRRIAGAGHEIASHGYAHRLVYDQTPDEFREDVRRAKGELEGITGGPVGGYRAPSYSVTGRSLWALDVLIEVGHVYDASIFPIHHDRYGIPDADRHPHMLTRSTGAIVEAPASTVRCGGVNLPIAGGGYFRLLPYRWTRWGIARLNRIERRPAIFYVHPWELDPEQPRIAAAPITRLRHYRNLEKTEGRLRNVIRDFRFSTLANLLNTASPRFETAVGPAMSAAGRATAAEAVQRRIAWF